MARLDSVMTVRLTRRQRLVVEGWAGRTQRKPSALLQLLIKRLLYLYQRQGAAIPVEEFARRLDLGTKSSLPHGKDPPR